jgi:hypothetical protein
MRISLRMVWALAAGAVGLGAWVAAAQDKSAAPKAQDKAEEKKPDDKKADEKKPEPKADADKNGKEPDGGEAGDDRGRLKRLAFGAVFQKVEPPQLPAMHLRGFLRTDGRPPAALLDIKEAGRYVVREGDRIPVMVNTVRTTAADGKAPRVEARGQTQILLVIKKISSDGVVIETGVLAQTIVIR